MMKVGREAGGGRKDIVSGSLMKVTDVLLSLGLMLQYYSYVAVS